MKKYRSIFFAGVILSLALIALLAASPEARAAVDAFGLDWWTVDSGGGQASGAGYNLLGVAGQYDANVLQGGGFILEGGFLNRASAPNPPVYHQLLPLTIKQ